MAAKRGSKGTKSTAKSTTKKSAAAAGRKSAAKKRGAPTETMTPQSGPNTTQDQQAVNAHRVAGTPQPRVNTSAAADAERAHAVPAPAQPAAAATHETPATHATNPEG